MIRPSVILRSLEQHPPISIYQNPYKAKRLWPPDFSQLSKKHQFTLERRYRRRTKLKWARPRWTKAVKLAQLGLITFVAVYGVLFLDWKQENQPFQTVRKWFWGNTSSIFPRGRDPRNDNNPAEDSSPVAAEARR